MFKQTRLRIFALITVIATVIITLMLSLIYAATTITSRQRGYSLLESYLKNDGAKPDDLVHQGPSPSNNLSPDRPNDQRHGMKDDHNRMVNLSTFYSVLYDPSGKVIQINSGDGNLYSEEDILSIADTILKKNSDRGSYNRLSYMISTNERGTCVALLDNTMEIDSSRRLILYSCLVGVVSWIIVLLLSWSFSKKIITPLEENDQRQKQFLSDASHELKTPISVISANAELLLKEPNNSQWISNIQYENERMGILVKQLLELARAENTPPNMETVDYSRLVSGESLIFESVAFENDRTLSSEIEDGITLLGNRNQLSQLVSILIDNAIRHSDPGKEISLRLFSNRHDAILSVTNAGDPIPEEIKSRLFERFYRRDDARTGDSGHYGLGLAIAKAIVTSHNGKIEVNCPDGLIEFRVSIPME